MFWCRRVGEGEVGTRMIQVRLGGAHLITGFLIENNLNKSPQKDCSLEGTLRVFCADLNAKYAKFYAKERKVVMLILPQIHRFLVIFREFLNRASQSFF